MGAKSTVDASKAVTKLQVRFHDGSRKAAEFNEDAPVQEIFDFVAPAVPGASFQILGGFPPKPLTDKAMTLKDAGSCNWSSRFPKYSETFNFCDTNQVSRNFVSFFAL